MQRGLISSSIANGLPAPESQLHTHCPLIVSLHRLVVIASPLGAPPSRPLVVLSLRRPLAISSRRLVLRHLLLRCHFSSPRPLTAPPSRHLIVQAGCCVASRRAAISSSHHADLLSSCCPFTAPPSCRLIVASGCCVASCCAVVLSSHRPLTPNITRGTRDNGGRCPPPPRMLNVVLWAGLAIASPLPSPSPLMLFLALQPCCHSHRSRRCRQCPFRRPPPSPTLVAITITITLFVAIAIARPPLLSLSPLLLPPLPFPLCCPPPSSLLPSPLPPSPLPFSSPTSLVTITITHVVAIAVNRLPPWLPLLLPPKPLLSSLHVVPHPRRQCHCPLHPTRPLRHPPPFPHRHRLSTLILFVTCYHC